MVLYIHVSCSCSHFSTPRQPHFRPRAGPRPARAGTCPCSHFSPPPPPAPFPAPSWPRPDLDPESSARATGIPLQKRLYIKAICKILEDFTFPEIPGAIFFGDPLRSSTGGNSDKSCSTPTFLARTSGPATPRVPKGPPKGISRKSPDNLKSLQIRQVL